MFWGWKGHVNKHICIYIFFRACSIILSSRKIIGKSKLLEPSLQLYFTIYYQRNQTTTTCLNFSSYLHCSEITIIISCDGKLWNPRLLCGLSSISIFSIVLFAKRVDVYWNVVGLCLLILSVCRCTKVFIFFYQKNSFQ